MTVSSPAYAYTEYVDLENFFGPANTMLEFASW